MKESKKSVSSRSISLGLDAQFLTLESQLSHVIDTIDGIKPLKPARKELKKIRLAVAALQRQIQLYEKDPTA